MNRIAKLFVTAAALLLISCGDDEAIADLQAENEELRTRIVELEDQLETTQAAAQEVRSDAEEVQATSESLRSEVDRLQTENWRDVVPDIDTSTSEVESAGSTLEDSVDDLDASLEQ